ncbi:inorganic phosphate transporter [Neisseriaceae bacterium CLB008]|nr:inorganic phosphate transporter [Neisseriaceae bacterium]
MFELFSGLTAGLVILLLLSLLLVLAFEFINGFHDTANAVATVIYTQSMKPTHAVLASAVFNFVGVLAGGLAVAYSIVHLLPVDVLASDDSGRMLAMIFALLIGAIIWNLATWYFGLPASSSHTLIGAIIGVGVANAMLAGQDLTQGINWGKAYDVGLSLLLSPIAGFFLAFFMLHAFRFIFPETNIHKSPYQRQDVEGRKHPAFWTRFMLILSACGVSFAHGSNDGQKGVGLVMLALICIVPGKFLLNLDTTQYQIERTVDAAGYLSKFADDRSTDINTFFPAMPAPETQQGIHCQATDTQMHAAELTTLFKGKASMRELSTEQRSQARSHLLCLDDAAKQFASLPDVNHQDKQYLSALRKDLALSTEYAPLWVIIAVASALGLGTMIGWKRVAKTVGEGIGKKHMTYAQGVCAQLTAAIGIGMANVLGLPVSTTQILSSGVAGTVVASKAGLQMKTIRNILLAWVFTFPAAMALAGGLFFLIVQFI